MDFVSHKLTSVFYIDMQCKSREYMNCRPTAGPRLDYCIGHALIIGLHCTVGGGQACDKVDCNLSNKSLVIAAAL